jgi:glycine/D-amino acid oxidase-like deaminating enzyme
MPDVVVVGAGVMGAWTALRCRRAGWSTTLIDAFGVGHPRATSGDETRILRSSHGPDAFYARWAREARGAWRSFGDEIGQPLFHEIGMLWFARREDGFEAASRATLRDLGVPISRMSPDDVRSLWPQIGTDDLAFATYEPEAGVVMARAGVAAVVRAFTSGGGRFELADVRPGRADGRRLLEVVAADGTRHAGGTFVFAAGPWLPRLFPDLLGPLVTVTKQDVVFLGPRGGDGRFAAEWLPCWVDYDGGFYGIPSVDGRGVKIAPDRDGPPFDATDGERVIDPDTVRQTRAYARVRFPALAGAPVIETRVCQYETTPDTEFLLDRHPDFDNVWIAGGGSGHAFMHGPVIGSYLVSRMAGAPPGPEEARFSLTRPRERGSHLRTGAPPR